jgi:hypothetical protein
MSRMPTERERDQHKISWLTVVRGGPYLPAGTLVLTTVRYLLDAINVLRPGQACGTVRRRSSDAERCSRLSFSTASHPVWQVLS